MLKKFHFFHMLEKSPWPLMSSNTFLMAVTSLVCWFSTKKTLLLLITLTLMMFSMSTWWKDMSKEGVTPGQHNEQINKNLQLGMILFITSEILFFTAFFWAFFHSSISPNIELGQSWPPLSITVFNPINVPLLNTLILLSSGVSITYSHHSFMESKKNEGMNSMLLTVSLGLFFTTLQAMEYMEAPYTLADSVYGTTFFMATGFHGLHVVIGSSFLLVTMLRMNQNSLSSKHPTGFECAAWYWHFVDVVWLFLYTTIYWWGS